MRLASAHVLGKRPPWRSIGTRQFSSTRSCQQIRDIETLSPRIYPQYKKSHGSDLLSLHWPQPPRNILIVKKLSVPTVTGSLIEFVRHITSTYPSLSIILEPNAAEEVHSSFPFPVYTSRSSPNISAYTHDKVDMVVTLGGDGTILRASSLFATCHNVPPVLSFSMGTLGFLGEWKFEEYKRAFREVYTSGEGDGESTTTNLEPRRLKETSDGSESTRGPTGWSSIQGKSMGSTPGARILMRNRLRVGLFGRDGKPINPKGGAADTNDRVGDGRVYLLNEVLIHRGKEPHLAVVEVFVGGRFLTEAVADGMIVSTPTGSTAYSLSSGGSIVHPIVPALLVTPVCPRSLSFRPLVLPSSSPVTLRLSEKNRGREVEVSIDGKNMGRGMALGMEVRVWDEDLRHGKNDWRGGVPCVMRHRIEANEPDDGWVGGLNSLLKFNYPFGADA